MGFEHELASLETSEPAPKPVSNTKKQEPPISLRLSKVNKVKLQDIHNQLRLDSINATLNHIIDNYSDYLKYKEKIEAMKVLQE